MQAQLTERATLEQRRDAASARVDALEQERRRLADLYREADAAMTQRNAQMAACTNAQLDLQERVARRPLGRREATEDEAREYRRLEQQRAMIHQLWEAWREAGGTMTVLTVHGRPRTGRWREPCDVANKQHEHAGALAAARRSLEAAERALAALDAPPNQEEALPAGSQPVSFLGWLRGSG